MLSSSTPPNRPTATPPAHEAASERAAENLLESLARLWRSGAHGELYTILEAIAATLNAEPSPVQPPLPRACTHCGKAFAETPCGPAHALIARHREA